MLGRRSLAIPATICKLSSPLSPKVIFPPIVTSPVTSILPATLTLFSKLIWSVALTKFSAPAVLSIVLPLILMFPVSILEPLINVVSPPLVNVTPSVSVMFNEDTAKSTEPFS